MRLYRAAEIPLRRGAVRAINVRRRTHPMSKHSRWIESESERWMANGIVTADQAARIRALYAESPQALSWGLIVFFGLGAVVIGLGVILLFAYNWDDIPKAGKLATVFGTVIAAHVGGLAFRRHSDWRARLGEALAVLGTMAFGAGIWLIAQIYNIDEHYPNGFLLWALGALALAWVLESVPQAILAAVLIAVWGSAEVLDFERALDASTLLVAFGVGLLAWRKRSLLLMTVVLSAVYWLLLCNAAHWGGAAAAFTNAIALSVLLLAVGKLLANVRDAGRIDGLLHIFGVAGFAFCSYLLSFREIVGSLLRWSHETGPHVFVTGYRWALFALAAVAWGWLLVRALAAKRRDVRADEWLAPIALIYCQAMSMWGVEADAQFVAIVFNLVCLGTATAWMVRGCRHSDLALTVCGSVLLALVVFARYFDLFESLAVRGFIFLLFGGVLFAEGFFYRRLRAVELPNGGGS